MKNDNIRSIIYYYDCYFMDSNRKQLEIKKGDKMNNKKNIKVLVNFSKSDIQILEELKKLTRLNKSEVIRQAVYNYLKNVKG